MATHVTTGLTYKEIKDFVQALNALHWKTDYDEFCQILGLTKGAYSLAKYAEFEQLCEALNNFSLNSLVTLVEAGTVADQTRSTYFSRMSLT